MNAKIDIYLEDGCGRCSLYKTPQCKVHTWQEELKQLRRIVLEGGLQEDFKWSQPCYTFQKKNILLVTAFKDYATVAFFKGSLLKDPYQILVAPGKNSQAVRQMRFTNVATIFELEPVLKAYISEALELEKKGLKITFKKNPEPIPEELLQKFNKDPEFKNSFEALTTGRQRGYILYFSQPKQSKTRASRIEKCLENILIGKGLHDR